MRRITLLALLAICAGCGSAPTVVGEWSTHSDSGDGKIVFRPDKTFHSESKSALAKLTLDGVYDFKGSSITMRAATWDIQSSLKLNTQDRADMDEGLKKESTVNVAWSGSDRLKLVSGDGQLTTAVRVKQ